MMQTFFHYLIRCLPALASFFFLYLFSFFCRRKTSVPVHWPFLGMLPGIVSHFRKLQDHVVDVDLRDAGCSLIVKGPLFLEMKFLVTCDPANVNHIYNTHFHSYAKGDEYKEIFEILGDGLLASDFETWKVQRKMAHSIFTDSTFRSFAVDTVTSRIRDGLIPLLHHMAERDVGVDVQDVFLRFGFATNYKIIMGVDSDCLTTSLPVVDFLEAIHYAEEALIFRQAVPSHVWKLLRWLNIGGERKLAKASQVVDRFITQGISSRRSAKEHNADTTPDMLTLYMNRPTDNDIKGGDRSDKFLRDTVVSFIIAGSDTVAVGLTWFFYAVAKYPNVERKILEELEASLAEEQEEGGGQEISGARVFTSQVLLRSMVYLQATLSETLRLFPPVPLDHKAALKDDVLPSGIRVRAGMRIIMSIYAMGRMKEVWGEDCMEFKPERWIGKDGRLRHEPTYKFMAFSTGPRSCIGKEHALTLMTMAAASLVYNFHFELVEGQDFTPKDSVLLYMANGCMV